MTFVEEVSDGVQYLALGPGKFQSYMNMTLTPLNILKNNSLTNELLVGTKCGLTCPLLMNKNNLFNIHLMKCYEEKKLSFFCKDLHQGRRGSIDGKNCAHDNQCSIRSKTIPSQFIFERN